MKVKKTVLKNGLRVLTLPMSDSQTAIAMVLVETGSQYESKSENGLSHFLEHMCFKGTKNRSGEAINLELDSLGAETNAFTSYEYTGYYARAHFNKASKLVEIVSDMYLYPTFPTEEIEKERGVIIDEIDLYDDQPNHIVGKNLLELMYGDTPAGFDIGGPKENIRKFKRQDFVNYHDKHYHAQNTVVVVAGNIDQKKVLDQVKNIFKDIPKAKKIKKAKVAYQKNKNPKIKLHYRKDNQVKILLAFPALAEGHKDFYKAEVLAGVLGQGMSSRLFKELREKRGLCYHVSASNTGLSDHGRFVVRLGTDKSKVVESLDLIMAELKRLKTELVSEKELSKAKNFINGNIAINLETSDQISSFYGFQEIHNFGLKKPSEVFAKVREVTASDLQKVAKSLFKDDAINLSVVGPIKDDKGIKKVLKF